MEVGFYHCTHQPALKIASRLAARAWESGQRLLITGTAERLQLLDKGLWVDDPASFLPHAMAGEAEDAEQPILLAETPVPENGEAANSARLLMVLEVGLPVSFERFDRVLNLFDDGTDAHTRARADWKAIGGRDGIQRVYWQQNERGGWEKRG